MYIYIYIERERERYYHGRSQCAGPTVGAIWEIAHGIGRDPDYEAWGEAYAEGGRWIVPWSCYTNLARMCINLMVLAPIWWGICVNSNWGSGLTWRLTDMANNNNSSSTSETISNMSIITYSVSNKHTSFWACTLKREHVRLKARSCKFNCDKRTVTNKHSSSTSDTISNMAVSTLFVNTGSTETLNSTHNVAFKFVSSPLCPKSYTTKSYRLAMITS